MWEKIKNTLFTNQSNKQILAKNTFWLGVIEVGSKLILLIITLAIVRYLGPKEFGAYNFALAFASIVSVVADLGINAILTRDTAKNKEMAEKLLANTLGMRLVGSLLVVAITLISYPFLGKNQTHFLLIILAVVYTLASCIKGSLLSVLTAFEKMEYLFVVRMGYYVGILITTLLVVSMNWGVVTILVGYILVLLLMMIVTGWLVESKLKVHIEIGFDLSEWKQLWIELWPMFGFMAAGAIYTSLDTILISRFFGNEQVGIYQAGYKILYAFQSVNIINSATFPRFSILIHENKREKLNQLLKWLVIGSGVVLTIIAGIITWQKDFIIQLIYGQAYNSAATIMAILIWGGIINYFRIMVTNLLVAERRQKQVFRAMVAGLVVNTILNLTIMPKMGINFAAVSLVISEAVILGVAVVMAKNKNG